MIRYDTISHKVLRYDTIRSESDSPYVRTACCQLQTTAIYGRTYSSKQATVHNTGAPSFCLSTLSPTHSSRCLDTGWPAWRWSAGSWFLWSPGSFNRATVSTGSRTARPFGGHTLSGRSHGSNIYSDCTITKYLSRATAFIGNTSIHPVGQTITAN